MAQSHQCSAHTGGWSESSCLVLQVLLSCAQLRLVSWSCEKIAGSLLFPSDNRCCGDGKNIPGTAPSSILILPTWLFSPPALKEVVPLLSKRHEVLSTFAVNNTRDFYAPKCYY